MHRLHIKNRNVEFCSFVIRLDNSNDKYTVKIITKEFLRFSCYNSKLQPLAEEYNFKFFKTFLPSDKYDFKCSSFLRVAVNYYNRGNQRNNREKETK